MRCLAKRPEERFAHAGAVVEALAEALDRRPDARKRARVALIAGVAVAIGAGATMLVRRPASPRIEVAPTATVIPASAAALPLPQEEREEPRSAPVVSAPPPLSVSTSAAPVRPPRVTGPRATPSTSAPPPAPACSIATSFDAEGQPHFTKVCK
jgi:hypothetical protein